MDKISKTLLLTFLFVLGTLSSSILSQNESFNTTSESYESGPRNMSPPTLEYLSPASNSTYNAGDVINITIELNDTDGDDIAYAYVAVQSGTWSNNVWGSNGNITTATNSTIITFSWNTWGYNAGTYYFNSNLTWTNGTDWSTWYSGVDYWNNYSINLVNSNNSGGGGNSGNTGCGYDVSFATVQATGIGHTMNGGTGDLSPNQNVTIFMTVNCAVYNSTMSLVYWIYDSNNSTWEIGNHSWYHQSSSTTFSHHWNTTAPSTNGNYNFIVELFINGSIEAWDNDPFTVGSNNSGDNGNTGCTPEVVINSYNPTNPNGFENQTTFNSNEPITLYAYHHCFPAGSYHWNSTVYGPSGMYEDNYGNLNFTNSSSNSWLTNVWEYNVGYLGPGEYTWYYGFTNWGGISRYVSHNFTIVNSTSSNNNSGGSQGCSPEVLLETYSSVNTFNSAQTIFEYGVHDIIFEATHICMPADEFHWNSTIYGPSGMVDSTVYGSENLTNGGNLHSTVHTFDSTTLPSGEYTWYYGFSNWWDISRYVSHNFTVIDNGTASNVTGSCSFPSFEATPYALYAGEDLTYNWTMTGDISSHVYLSLHSGWGTQYYYSGIVVNDGSHTITLPSQMNPNLDYTVYVESAFQDARTTLCWKYGAIDILGSNEGPLGNETNISPTVDLTPRISMWYGKVNQHNENGTWMTDPDGVAGAGSYDDWGDEGWGDRKLEYCQRFWPDTVDVVLRDSPEEIIFYTRYNSEAYLSTKPVWECILEGAQITELTGVCSFDLTITPTELEVGDTLTVTWTMTGDIPVEVGIAFFSTVQGQWNVGVQYHLSEITANDGGFAYSIPQGMNPDRDYYMYIDAELTDDFTTYCWKYGSFDILASNEGALEEVLENLFNSTDRTPRISMWYGKVNQHNENGTWMTDPDGTAGAGNFNQFGSDGWGDRKLEYCQRFWPDTVSVAPMGAEQIVFYTGGNQVAYLTTKPVWQCVQDTDGDGILDPDDADDDNDGWSDILEQACGTNELDVNDVPADSDGDQICDLLDDALDEVVTDATEEDAGFLPGFSAISGLAALGAAMLIGRRRSN